MADVLIAYLNSIHGNVKFRPTTVSEWSFGAIDFAYNADLITREEYDFLLDTYCEVQL